MPTTPPGDYRHYKGPHYRVLGTARHSETEEELVVYRQLYGEFGLWVRPAAMFAETVTRDGVEQPRFAPLGTPYRPLLTAAQHARARTFIQDEARPLEQALYAFHFAGGSAEEVLTELSRFQNEDGGCGHGLEPDLQTPPSSVLATTVALQIARAVGAPATHPLVRRAVGYLVDAYDADHGYWPIIPADVDDAAHAPWWQSGASAPEHAARYVFNPGAEVVGYLWAYSPQTPLDTRRRLLEHVLTALEARVGKPTAQAARSENPAALEARSEINIEMHELLCLLRLLETPELPADAQARLLALLRPVVARSVVTEPSAWSGYGLQPLDVAGDPASPFAPAMADALDLNLLFRMAQQGDDGAWQPAWNWGDSFADAWPAARRAWSGVLTVAALRGLAAWGRVERE